MSSKIYAFVSPKGGSGKTITAITLGSILAGLGKSVVLIDTDASTNGLTLFYLDKVTLAKKTNTKGLQGTFDIDETIDADATEVSKNFSVIPATFSMRQTEKTELAKFKKRLSNILAKASSKYEFIFLDAQAGTDAFAEMAVSQAHEVIIVSEFDPISAQGIERMKILFNDAFNEKQIWTLFNKVLPEFIAEKTEFPEVNRYLPPIPWDAAVVRAYVRKRSAIDMDGGNTFTLGIMKTASPLFGPSIEERISIWMDEKTDLIRKPVVDFLAQIESLISEVEEDKINLKYKRKNLYRSISRNIGLMIAFLAALMLLGEVFRGRAAFRWLYELYEIIGLHEKDISPAISILLVVGFASITLIPIILGSIFGLEDEVIEKQRVGLDLQLQRLREERARLLPLVHATLPDLLKQGPVSAQVNPAILRKGLAN